LQDGDVKTLYKDGLTDIRRLDILTTNDAIQDKYIRGLTKESCTSGNTKCDIERQKASNKINEISAELSKPVYTAPKNTEKKEKVQQNEKVEKTKTSLEKTKNYIKKGKFMRPNEINKMSNTIGGIHTAVLKFKTGDPIRQVSGVLDITASLAAFGGPAGVAVAAGAGLLNAVLGLFGANGPSLQKVIGDMIQEQTNQIDSMFQT